MYQQITIVGNLGRDPESRTTQDGKHVCNFNVAVNNVFADKKTTAWFRVSAWNGLGEVCTQYLSKGNKVLVTGILRYDPATGGPNVFRKNDGSSGAAFELMADTVRFLTPKGETEPVGAQGSTDFPF